MSLIDSALNAYKFLIETVSDSVESITTEWNEKVAELKLKAAQFTSAYSELEQSRQYAVNDPQLNKDIDGLLSSGNYIRQSIEWITSKIDAVYTNWIGPKKSEMGLFQLAPIPLVAIAGAITVVTVWLTDYAALKSRIELAKQAMLLSNDPKSGADILKSSGDQPLINMGSPVSGALLLSAIGFALYYFGPKIKEFLK